MSANSKIIDYIEAAILWKLRSRYNDLHTSFEPRDVQINVLANHVEQPPGLFGVSEAFNRLVDAGIFTVISDEMAGNFYAINRETLISHVEIIRQDPASLYSKIAVVGLPFLDAALKGAPESEDNLEPIEFKSLDVPASDRIVNLNHNQVETIDEQTSELISAIERENAIPDSPGLREQIIGHLRAGRELVRVGVFNAQLFYLSLVVGIKMLIEKYKDHAIGALASKLLDLILQEIGIS